MFVRRNLRLAPGLSIAGFTEEPVEHPGGDADSNNNSSSNINNDGDADAAPKSPPHDKTFATLQTLSRGNRRGRQTTGRMSLSNNVDTSKGNDDAKAAGAESVILLTRLGSARHEDGSDSPDEYSVTVETPGGALTSGATNTAPADGSIPEATTAARLRRLWSQQKSVGAAGSEPQIPGTADGMEQEDGCGLILHVCHGPGTFRAVREALAEGRVKGGGGGNGAVPIVGEGPEVLSKRGRKNFTDDYSDSGSGAAVSSQSTPPPISTEQKDQEAQPMDKQGGEEYVGGGSASAEKNARGEEGTTDGENAPSCYDNREESGEALAAGLGCTIIGGCTVAALGSLRRHGAYCVVELGMPTTNSSRRTGTAGDEAVANKGGWSVASVSFGAIPGGEGERCGGAGSRGITGNFVRNF